MTDGEKFKLLRSALGYSQRELAAKLTTSQAVISAIELDKNPVSRRILMLLEEKFRLNTDWFINERGEMFGKPVAMTTITGDNKDEIIRILKEQILQLQVIINDKSRIIRLLEDRLLTTNDSN